MPEPGASFDTFHRDDAIVGPSDRSFGLVFTGVFAVVALLPLWRGAPVRSWAAWTAAGLLGVALLRPGSLAIPNRLWLRFGLLLHRIVNPVVMGVLFYAVLTPFALVMRRFRRDAVRRFRRDPGAPSYWIPRAERRSGMEQQF